MFFLFSLCTSLIRMKIVITGIANVGGLAGTQMPERVLSDAYEKGGKQMIGALRIIFIIFIIIIIMLIIIIIIISPMLMRSKQIIGVNIVFIFIIIAFMPSS